MTTTTISSLEDLRDALRRAPRREDHQHDADEYYQVTAGYAETLGLPLAQGEIDYSSLPTFGGDAVDLPGVWSWDADRLLIGSCAEDLAILPRR